MNGFDFPAVDLQTSEVVTLAYSVTTSHGNSPSQDGRNFSFLLGGYSASSSESDCSDCSSARGGAAGVPEVP